MKKIISVLLVVAMLFSVTACGNKSTQVTLSSFFFDGQTEDEIKAAAKENGYIDCEVNDDGSVTYTMSEKKYDEILDEMKSGFDELAAGCLSGENKVDSFVDIRHDDDFSEIDIYVDAEKYTALDGFYALTFYVTGAFYQAFNGVADDDIDVVVNFIDNETEEILNTASYRDFLSSVSGDDIED